MSGINKNILQGILISSYIIVIGLCVFGISALYSYLNTGAERSSILHTELKKTNQYLPKLTWAPIKNVGRPIDDQTLKMIENDYLDAWYVRHVAYKNNQKQGLSDYYTKKARQNIFSTIDLNISENTSIESTTLEHHPTLEFFSEDGQLAVVTDHNVIEYKRIYKGENLLLETTEISTYKVILLLEDGFWRIRHLVRQHVQEEKKEINLPVFIEGKNIKGINYYPKATPWDMFGAEFNVETIAKDFTIIKEAGLNTIRIFVPYDDFGKAKVKSKKLKKLKQILDAAESQGLKVMITLFDFYGDYSVLDWTLNHRHAETIVSTFKDHNAIMAWDIKNEPNLDFKSRDQSIVTAWLRHMLTLVKSIDPNHPVTIGWSNDESANILKDKVDFVSFHYYKKINALESTYKRLRTQIPNKPVILTEYGISSYNGIWNFLGNSENDQAKYHESMQDIFSKNEIPFFSWTLYDFENVPKAVVGRLPWRRNIQQKFGFISTDGTKKVSFKFISK